MNHVENSLGYELLTTHLQMHFNNHHSHWTVSFAFISADAPQKVIFFSFDLAIRRLIHHFTRLQFTTKRKIKKNNEEVEQGLGELIFPPCIALRTCSNTEHSLSERVFLPCMHSSNTNLHSMIVFLRAALQKHTITMHTSLMMVIIV